MSSPVNLGKKKSVPETPNISPDEDSDHSPSRRGLQSRCESQSRRESLPGDMVEAAIAKESPSNFKTPNRSSQKMPATENSPLDSRESGSFTPKTPVAPLRDHGPFTRRSLSVKELPRKALFQGSSQSSSSSNYKTPDRSQEKISGEEHRPLDSTSDGEVTTAPNSYPQPAPRQSRRSRSRLLENPEMPLQPKALF